MGLLDAVPVIGPILDSASSIINAQSASDAYKHRYQTEVADLKAAGLNPALAYGQNPGVPPATTNLGQPGESFTRGISAAASAQQAQANADLTDAQTTLLRTQSADLASQVALRNKQIAQETATSAAQQTRTQVETENVQWDTALKGQLYEFNKRTLDDRVAMVKVAAEQSGIDLDTSKVQKTLLELEKPEAQATADYFKKVGAWDPALQPILGIVRALLPGGAGTFMPRSTIPPKTFNFNIRPR